MVIAESQIHHRPDHDLTLHDDSALGDIVQAEDRRLRIVDDRSAEHRSVDATVGDGKHASLKITHLDRTFSSCFSIAEDILFDLSKSLLIAITNSRYHQSLVGADGDADIKVMLRDDFIAFNPCVYSRHGLQRVCYCFGEE